MDAADEIWNRALDEEPFSDLPGDRALHAVLMFHGHVMGGGMDPDDGAVDAIFRRYLEHHDAFAPA